MEDMQMSIIEHLAELRKRIVISIGGLIFFSILGYSFITDILKIFTKPVGKDLVYLVPTEAFFTQLKLSMFVGFLLALPIILYQIWRFVLPGLKKEEKRYLLVLVPLSYIFFLIGVAFAFFIVIPFGIKFFLGFSSDGLEAMFSLNKYISFIIKILIPFGIIFELPLLITLLVKLNLITSNFLKNKRRYVIVSIFVLSAILTPPDIISQAMMAVPLIFLYEFSIVVARIIE
ncbi:twin arginine-targeting protein translocase TatC [Orenia metallireducens]|uniref:Sec-independent protein translocase protein TatC n=1 Tax=Orenia metallireducens TaxID=1413210 RepID=A0A1C0ABL4_9FIRM|nr:twin-arginine translocase subunit TatC [Orenia metallireducens]OCL27738.1 twin arginine-targeting protein translocase TatC [Orenia metallireducens]